MVLPGIKPRFIPQSVFIRPQPSNNICLKVFIVATVFFAAAVVAMGALALLASGGSSFAGLNAIASLTAIGSVHSYIMLCGGTLLLALGILTWGCHLHLASLSAPN